MNHAHGIVLDTFNMVAQTNSTTVTNYSAIVQVGKNKGVIGGGNGEANTASAVSNSYQGRLCRANHLAS